MCMLEGGVKRMRGKTLSIFQFGGGRRAQMGVYNQQSDFSFTAAKAGKAAEQRQSIRAAEQRQSSRAEAEQQSRGKAL